MRTTALIIALACFGWLAVPLLANDTGERRVAAGRVLYKRYCASCHGASGNGAGPVAPYLRVPPADLTRLAEHYGWPLPRVGLARHIDGRFNPGAHGAREMPVWGERLEELPPEIVGERDKATVIELILDFLESIQGGPKT